MKLQVAIDTLTVEQAIELVEETEGVVDIIEVGTPLIIQDGMRSIRVLSDIFTDIPVLADTKIMDAGELEATIAFDDGADIVTVLGVAYNETILGVLKAAKHYGKEVMVDMIGVQDIKTRAIELDEMGVDYICVHTAFDIQNQQASPLEELLVVQSVVKKAKTAIAGGINFNNIEDIAFHRPDVIIVGGTISNAPDPKEAARQLKERFG